MGTWSVEPFGNDSAADWAFELEEAGDLQPIEAAIDAVLAAGDDYLEASDADIAIAAIDVLARVRGSPGEVMGSSRVVDAFVASLETPPDPDLIEQALAALDRIVGENSELRDLWEESDEFDAWKAAIEALRVRLEA